VLAIGKIIFEKLLSKVMLLFVITFIAFILMNISRVDPAESYVRRHATIPDEAVINQLREEMGLNKPIAVQYVDWLKNIVQLDFGISLVTGKPVEEDIALYIKPTLLIVGISLVIIIIMSTLFGILSAVYENTVIDKIIKIMSVIGVSVPNFWVGYILLYLFALKLHLFPSISEVSLRGAFLPAITMALVPISHYCRLLRANMIQELRKEYITNCYAKGIKRTRIIMIHAFKNAIQSVIPLFFQNIGYLISGSAVIEAVFSWPGLGMYTLHAIVDRDFPVVVAFIMLSAIIFSITSIMAEVIAINMNKRLMENSYE